MDGVPDHNIAFRAYAHPYLLSAFRTCGVIRSDLAVCEGVQPDAGMPMDKCRDIIWLLILNLPASPSDFPIPRTRTGMRGAGFRIQYKMLVHHGLHSRTAGRVGARKGSIQHMRIARPLRPESHLKSG